MNRQLFGYDKLDSDFRRKGLIVPNAEPWGIPQGSPISAVLSNIYLVEFDVQMKALAALCKGSYRRYCDDILFVVPIEKAEWAKRAALDGLRANRLTANIDKVDTSTFSRKSDRTLHADRPLQYLGFTFDGKRTLLRGSTLAKYFRRVKDGARSLVAAWAKGDPGDPAPLWGLYERYTHLGHRNFYSYSKASSLILKDEAPKRQLRGHWRFVQQALDEELKKKGGGPDPA